jgi:uncharacterized protein (DUF488 family)
MKRDERNGVVECWSDGVMGRETPALPHNIPSSVRLRTIVTLGVYGYDEAGFFGALRDAGVDTFCDIRFRRGVRGRDYSFVNSRRLQARLAEMGVRYLHLKELAPGQSLRDRQRAADRAQREAKRQRARLSESFIAGYREQCLDTFDSAKFMTQLGEEARVAALFCVERLPEACHRSLLAERLQRELGIDVVHLTSG